MRMLTKLMNDKELDEKTVTLPYGIVRRAQPSLLIKFGCLPASDVGII